MPNRKQRRAKANLSNPLPELVTPPSTTSEWENIQQYADKFASLDKLEQDYSNRYIQKGKSAEYYHGSYVTLMQVYNLAVISDNPIYKTYRTLIYAVCDKLIGYRPQLHSDSDILE